MTSLSTLHLSPTQGGDKSFPMHLVKTTKSISNGEEEESQFMKLEG